MTRSCASIGDCSQPGTPIRSRPTSGDALVGGLYGVSLRGAFFGESMFHRARDASKVALVHLFARLRAGGFRLLDAQFLTEHLASLGAVGDVRARRFGAGSPRRLEVDADFGAWPAEAAMSGAEALATRCAAARKLRRRIETTRRASGGGLARRSGQAAWRRLTKWGLTARCAAAALPRGGAMARGDAARTARLAPRPGRIHVPPHRHHLRRLRRQGRRRAADPVRHRAAPAVARRMAEAGGRPDPAGERAQPVPEGRLRGARDPQGDDRSAGTDPAQSLSTGRR